MGNLKFADAYPSCRLLLEQGKYGRLVEVLRHASPEYENSADWMKLIELLGQVPEAFLLGSLEAAFLYARALRGCHDLEALVGWGAKAMAHHGLMASASIQVEAAAALNGLGRYAEARDLLNEAMPHLSGERLGLAWSRLGYALFHLGQPWREAYARARELLEGEELGRALLNEGFCLGREGHTAEARKVWVEALAYFQHNPYFQALTRHNLGMSYLRELDLEAERHFLEAARLTHHPRAATLRAVVTIGLAATRRMLGEWNRAETAYREALHVASDAHDRKEAYLGLIRTLRLAGRVAEALETIELALQDGTFEHQMLYVAKGMAYLRLGRPRMAREALDKVGAIRDEADRWLFRIAQAELARQEDHFDNAVGLLEGLPTNTLHAREEARQWPQLFALLAAVGREVPQPLEYVARTTVQVRAQGVLQVSVNGRPVEILPTGRVGELLVFLLEQGGSASLETIGDALYPDFTEAKRRRQAVWKLVDKLREALGWKGSVRSLRGAYQLDPEAEWRYDVAEARARGEFSGEFLAGVYSEWALEVGRELQGLRPEWGERPRPN